MYLSTSAVPDALLPWQPNSSTSIKCPRPGAELVQYCSTSFFCLLLLLSFSDIVRRAYTTNNTAQFYFINKSCSFQTKFIGTAECDRAEATLGAFYLFFLQYTDAPAERC